MAYYSSYATSFVAFVNALKTALVSAGKPNALVTVDAINSNVNGTWCSGNSGYLDFSLLQSAAGMDRVIIEDYSANFVTATWAAPTTCGSPLVNYYGSAVLHGVNGSTNIAACDASFIGNMIMMCSPNLGPQKAVIGIFASVGGTNDIAGQAMQYLASYGFTKVAVWPQYDNNTYQFMSTDGIVPSNASWYSLLATFLGN